MKLSSLMPKQFPHMSYHDKSYGHATKLRFSSAFFVMNVSLMENHRSGDSCCIKQSLEAQKKNCANMQVIQDNEWIYLEDYWYSAHFFKEYSFYAFQFAFLLTKPTEKMSSLTRKYLLLREQSFSSKSSPLLTRLTEGPLLQMYPFLLTSAKTVIVFRNFYCLCSQPYQFNSSSTIPLSIPPNIKTTYQIIPLTARPKFFFHYFLHPVFIYWKTTFGTVQKWSFWPLLNNPCDLNIDILLHYLIWLSRNLLKCKLSYCLCHYICYIWQEPLYRPWLLFRQGKHSASGFISTRQSAVILFIFVF